MLKLPLAALCILCGGQASVAQQAPAPEDLSPIHGLFMMDYVPLNLANGADFDLLGISYLQQFNDWLYWGGGIAAPMVQGNYGGFFAANATLHAQKQIFGNWFVDAGLSLGAGAGGASVEGIKELSGSGAYSREYIGLGYQTGRVNLGVNYAKVQVSNSQIDDSALNLFLQVPLSYQIGRYADAGTSLGPAQPATGGADNIISLQYGNLVQIDPQGKYGGDIGLVSAQFSHVYDGDDYLFLGLDLGTSGLVWYNQVQGGIGRKFALSPHVNLYGQVGIGSGGWVTDTIDTGPGLIVFPAARAEYLWDNGLGAYLSGGYLFAPKGSSRNWALGAGLNYHLGGRGPGKGADETAHDLALRGVRANLFARREFGVTYNGTRIDDLDLAALQLDYAFDPNWYVPLQVSVAVNDFKGFAGYVEAMAGLGWQGRPSASGRFQPFAQVLYGMSDVGIDAEHDVGALLNASFGVNYALDDRYAVYGQVGQTVSLGQFLRPDFHNAFESTSIGLGLTYRFSLPTRVAR